MPLNMVRNDITRMQADAIVCPTDEMLSGGGGADARIHQAAGPMLDRQCALLGGCETGKVVVTDGYDLPCRYILHTVGPRWRGGRRKEREQLAACYQHALDTARVLHCASVAFPLISSGTFGFPGDEALHIAADTIQDWLRNAPVTDEDEMQVSLVLFSDETVELAKKLKKDIEKLISSSEVADIQRQVYHSARTGNLRRPEFRYSDDEIVFGRLDAIKPEEPEPQTNLCFPEDSIAYPEICRDEDMEIELDESFTQMLLRKIDERGITDPECYKNANLDRKHFSKIRSDLYYKPKKETVFALAVSLKMDLDETRELLQKAGYSLSRSFISDVIVEYFISHRNWNIAEINEALFHYDQKLLGN